MLGIAHHSPVVISVYLDRLRFRPHLVNTTHEGWENDLDTFTTQPRDGRQPVVFVETLAGLKTIIRRNPDSLRKVKVAVYDTLDHLQAHECTVVDAREDQGSWEVVNVSLDEFNDALADEPQGVPFNLLTKEVKGPGHDIIEEIKRSQEQVATAVDVEPEVSDDDDDDETPEEVRLPVEEVLDDPEADDDDEDDEDITEALAEAMAPKAAKAKPVEPPPVAPVAEPPKAPPVKAKAKKPKAKATKKPVEPVEPAKPKEPTAAVKPKAKAKPKQPPKPKGPPPAPKRRKAQSDLESYELF